VALRTQATDVVGVIRATHGQWDDMIWRGRQSVASLGLAVPAYRLAHQPTQA
jgi:hypothetical protein